MLERLYLLLNDDLSDEDVRAYKSGKIKFPEKDVKNFLYFYIIPILLVIVFDLGMLAAHLFNVI